MKNKTKKNLLKHSSRLKYLKLQRKKINGQIWCEVKALKRITGKKRTKDMMEIIKKLEEGKILVDDGGELVQIYNPELMKKVMSSGVKLR